MSNRTRRLLCVVLGGALAVSFAIRCSDGGKQEIAKDCDSDVSLHLKVHDDGVTLEAEFRNQTNRDLEIDSRGLEPGRFVVIRYQGRFVGNLTSFPRKLADSDEISLSARDVFRVRYSMLEVFPSGVIEELGESDSPPDEVVCDVFCEYSLDPFTTMYPWEASELPANRLQQVVASNELHLEIPLRFFRVRR